MLDMAKTKITTSDMAMLNMDFGKRVVIETAKQNWLESPHKGVWRKPLAREGIENGHATSTVRYDAGASFASHEHPSGEELLVLEGTFSDTTRLPKSGSTKPTRLSLTPWKALA